MESGAGGTAHKLTHLGLLLCGVVLGVAWANGDAMAQGQPVTGEYDAVVEGRYEGVVVLPNPWNLWTGTKITDEECFVRVRRHEPGSVAVESSFNEEPVIVHVDNIRGESFYMGRFGDGQALVLQFYPGGVSLAHTSFDRHGVLNYGGYGDGNFTRECMC